MSDSDSHRRDVAGRFNQAARNAVFDTIHRLFPDNAAWITEFTERVVEEAGFQAETVEVILQWFRSDADGEWLDQLWQSPEGIRFLALQAELMMRADLRLHHPQVSVPPPGTTPN